jgi:hypothetical protein
VRETPVVVFGGGLLFGFLIIGIGSLVIAIMAAVDASKYPDWAFQQVGTTKFVWQILPIVLLFVCGIAGAIMGVIWYSSKRAEVESAARAGGSLPYGYGAPPAGGLPPGGWAPPSAPPPPPPPPPAYQPPPPPPPEPPQ